MSIHAVTRSVSNEIDRNTTSPNTVIATGKTTAATQIQFLRPTLGVTQPDQVTIASQATQEFYKRALTRYRRQRGARMTRFGRVALETLSTLLPSVVAVLERPYLEDTDIGVITGRSILSLIKEGAEKRPNCVLTSHYMAEMLGLYQETVSMASVSTETPEPKADDITHISTDERRQRAIEAMERALTDLAQIGLIQREAQNNTELLHPYSERKAGQENLFDWLMSQRKARLGNAELDAMRETHADALRAFQDNRYLLDVIYFSDRDFQGISGWDMLSLILEAENQMLGAVPAKSISEFFNPIHEKAVKNCIYDLAEKVGIITQNTIEAVEGQDAIRYIQCQPYAAIALNMRFNPPR